MARGDRCVSWVVRSRALGRPLRGRARALRSCGAQSAIGGAMRRELGARSGGSVRPVRHVCRRHRSLRRHNAGRWRLFRAMRRLVRLRWRPLGPSRRRMAQTEGRITDNRRHMTLMWRFISDMGRQACESRRQVTSSAHLVLTMKARVARPGRAYGSKAR
jgi:hypothetical protein